MNPVLAGILALACLGLSASCGLSGEINRLPDCWNLNTQNDGRVQGAGIFIESMHGLSLQSPGCSDRLGRNSFKLSQTADSSVRTFLIKSPKDSNYIGFSFSGVIHTKDAGKVLYIDSVEGLRRVNEPRWISDTKSRLSS